MRLFAIATSLPPVVRWILTILTGLTIGYVIGQLWYVSTVTILGLEGNQQQFGYHFHHSLLALIPLALLIKVGFKDVKALFLIAVALGIIIEHRLNYDAFLFVTKL
jgi:hypothetical protein